MEGKAIKSQQHPSNAPHSWRMISRGHNHHIHSGTRTFDTRETHRTETAQLTQEAGEVGQGVQGFLGWLPGVRKKTGHLKSCAQYTRWKGSKSGHVDRVDELIEMHSLHMARLNSFRMTPTMHGFFNPRHAIQHQHLLQHLQVDPYERIPSTFPIVVSVTGIEVLKFFEVTTGEEGQSATAMPREGGSFL